MTKITCPKCGRCLGDTQKSLDCRLNCRWCKEAVSVKIRVATTNDYFKMKGDK